METNSNALFEADIFHSFGENEIKCDNLNKDRQSSGENLFVLDWTRC